MWQEADYPRNFSTAGDRYYARPICKTCVHFHHRDEADFESRALGTWGQCRRGGPRSGRRNWPECTSLDSCGHHSAWPDWICEELKAAKGGQ